MLTFINRNKVGTVRKNKKNFCVVGSLGAINNVERIKLNLFGRKLRK